MFLQHRFTQSVNAKCQIHTKQHPHNWDVWDVCYHKIKINSRKQCSPHQLSSNWYSRGIKATRGWASQDGRFNLTRIRAVIFNHLTVMVSEAVQRRLWWRQQLTEDGAPKNKSTAKESTPTRSDLLGVFHSPHLCKDKHPPKKIP